MTTQVNGDTGVSQCQPNSVSQDDLQANVVGKGPAFRAAVSAVTASAGTYTRVSPYLTENFDTNNNFDLTSGRFTPTVAGYYQVTGQVTGGGTAQGVVNAAIYLNGSAINTVQGSSPAGFTSIANVSGLCFMNGSTDYLELWGRDTANANFGLCIFSACLVRAA